MKSSVFDINGTEVKLGDTLGIPYVDPMGKCHPAQTSYYVTVIFEHGCFGYNTEVGFVPLFRWEETSDGEYIPNKGCSTVYSGKCLFSVQRIR